METLTLVPTFDVDQYYDNDIFEEGITTVEDLHEVVPRLCFPKFETQDFTSLVIHQAEDHGNLILWKEENRYIKIIELMEDDDLVLRPDKRDKTKEFGLFQAAAFIEPIRQIVGETGAFYTVFRDRSYWLYISNFLNFYVPHLQDTIRNRFRIANNRREESEIAKIQQVLHYQRTTCMGKANLNNLPNLDRNLIINYIDTIDELCWLLIEIILDINTDGLPDYLNKDASDAVG